MSASIQDDKVNSKPEHCISCTESLNNEQNSLPCGHWVHMDCITKQFKAECPLCRHPLNIPVFGSRPSPYIPYNEENDFDNNILSIILFGQIIGVETYTLEQLSSHYQNDEINLRDIDFINENYNNEIDYEEVNEENEEQNNEENDEQSDQEESGEENDQSDQEEKSDFESNSEYSDDDTRSVKRARTI